MKRWIWQLLLLVSFCSVALAQDFQKNWLCNPGAEEALGRRGKQKKLAKDWLPTGQGYKRNQSRYGRYQGRAGFQTHLPDCEDVAGAYQCVTFDFPKSEFTLSYVVQCDNVEVDDEECDGAYLLFDVQFTDGSSCKVESEHYSGSFDWQGGCLKFTAPCGKAIVRGTLYILESGVTDSDNWVWWDNLKLNAVDGLTPPPPPPPTNKKGAWSLTFDDATASGYGNGVPQVIAHGFVCDIAVVLNYSLNGFSGYMNMQQLQYAQNNLHCGILCHSYTHPNTLGTAAADVVQHELVDSKAALAQNGLQNEIFVWPYGVESPALVQAAQAAGYLGARGTLDGINHHSMSPFNVLTHELRMQTTMADIESWIAEAEADPNGAYLELFTHEVSDTGDPTYRTTPAFLKQVLDRLATSNLRNMRMRDALTEFAGLPAAQ